jgi:hypothetical protein
MADRETELTDDRRIKFRIGIDRGDSIAESDNIFRRRGERGGRLEALVKPGAGEQNRRGAHHSPSAHCRDRIRNG